MYCEFFVFSFAINVPLLLNFQSPTLWFTPRYTEEANNIEQENTVLAIQFVTLDCSPLKASLVQHCNEWQARLTQLLNHMASNRLKGLHDSLLDSMNRWGLKWPYFFCKESFYVSLRIEWQRKRRRAQRSVDIVDIWTWVTTFSA